LRAVELRIERGRVRVQQARLADQVEADVRERDVFLERRAVAAPLGVALAEDQRVVGETQDVLEMLRRRHIAFHVTCG
jgi:hypothetical protein